MTHITTGIIQHLVSYSNLGFIMLTKDRNVLVSCSDKKPCSIYNCAKDFNWYVWNIEIADCNQDRASTWSPHIPLWAQSSTQDLGFKTTSWSSITHWDTSADSTFQHHLQLNWWIGVEWWPALSKCDPLCQVKQTTNTGLSICKKSKNSCMQNGKAEDILPCLVSTGSKHSLQDCCRVL